MLKKERDEYLKNHLLFLKKIEQSYHSDKPINTYNNNNSNSNNNNNYLKSNINKHKPSDNLDNTNININKDAFNNNQINNANLKLNNNINKLVNLWNNIISNNSENIFNKKNELKCIDNSNLIKTKNKYPVLSDRLTFISSPKKLQEERTKFNKEMNILIENNNKQIENSFFYSNNLNLLKSNFDIKNSTNNKDIFSDEYKRRKIVNNKKAKFNLENKDDNNDNNNNKVFLNYENNHNISYEKHTSNCNNNNNFNNKISYKDNTSNNIHYNNNNQYGNNFKWEKQQKSNNPSVSYNTRDNQINKIIPLLMNINKEFESKPKDISQTKLCSKHSEHTKRLLSSMPKLNNSFLESQTEILNDKNTKENNINNVVNFKAKNMPSYKVRSLEDINNNIQNSRVDNCETIKNLTANNVLKNINKDSNNFLLKTTDVYNENCKHSILYKNKNTSCKNYFLETKQNYAKVIRKDNEKNLRIAPPIGVVRHKQKINNFFNSIKYRHFLFDVKLHESKSDSKYNLDKSIINLQKEYYKVNNNNNNNNNNNIFDEINICNKSNKNKQLLEFNNKPKIIKNKIIIKESIDTNKFNIKINNHIKGSNDSNKVFKSINCNDMSLISNIKPILNKTIKINNESYYDEINLLKSTLIA